MTEPVCDEGLALIKRFEGCEMHPYRDAVGVWTIGYGATYGLDGRPVTGNHRPIDQSQAEALLCRDTLRFASAVDRLVRVPIDEFQRAALVSFSFNLGAGALQSSTLLRRVNARDWEDVPYQFSRWVHAGGRRLRGLVLRREAEAALWQLNTVTTVGPRRPFPTAPGRRRSCIPTSARRCVPCRSPAQRPAHR